MSAALVDREGVPRRALALTIHQPWATLIARGFKRVENRTWTPSPLELSPGDFVLLHAGRGFDAVAWEAALAAADAEGARVELLEALRRPLATARSIASRSLRAASMRGAEAIARELVPFSAIVGVARFVGVIEPTDSAAFGRWYEGPFGWEMDDAVEVEPVVVQGAPGLFGVESKVFATVVERWHEAAFG
ncbi:MAG: ASCH domain-containing protein [Polyangiales bacterium]